MFIVFVHKIVKYASVCGKRVSDGLCSMWPEIRVLAAIDTIEVERLDDAYDD